LGIASHHLLLTATSDKATAKRLRQTPKKTALLEVIYSITTGELL
jgi:hypothetical protein